MGYRLFLDDERDPPRDNQAWVVVRSHAEAVEVVRERGVPSYISFDHDLGQNSQSGFEFVKWLCNFIADGLGEFPDDFDFYVHSQNPVGRINIQMYLSQFQRFHKKGE